MRQGKNAIEAAKAAIGGDPLRIREAIPGMVGRGFNALTKTDKELLKWLGLFARARTPGRFMLRIRMPNGFASSEQLRAIADLSSRFGNSVLDLTTRQQIELRGFTLESVEEIWERLRTVNLSSLQTGMDNVRNVNGCPLAGLTPHELLDASSIVFDLDRWIVGSAGNPEFANLPRKFNITVTGCLENCTHCESQDIALVPAIAAGCCGFNVLVGGKMGSGGFTVASPLDVFVEPQEAVAVVAELIRIYRDHGPRQARGRCRFAFLIDEWGLTRLRDELADRLGSPLQPAGRDCRSGQHVDHLGVNRQKDPTLVSVGLCVPTGRIDPEQLAELAYLADEYGTGRVRLTTGQNAILCDVDASRVPKLVREPLVRTFSPDASPLVRGLVTCIGTDFCNLALIDTKGPALALSAAVEKRLGKVHQPLTLHWSGCQAGCGNHQAADIGFRGVRATVEGESVEAVDIFVGGRTGPDAVAGRPVLQAVPCDERLPDIVAGLIRARAWRLPIDTETAPSREVEVQLAAP
jgi:ferredoxin-nitrite reductase